MRVYALIIVFAASQQFPSKSIEIKINLNEIFLTTGCPLIMGHAVDKDLLCLVHDEVKDLIQVYNSIQSELNLQNTNAKLKEMDSCQETRLDEYQDRLGALEEKLQEASKNRSDETGKILQRLVSFKERLSVRLQAIEERVEQLEKNQTKTVSDMEQLKGSHTRTAAKIEQNAERCTKAVDKVEQIELDLKGLKTQDCKPGKLTSGHTKCTCIS